MSTVMDEEHQPTNERRENGISLTQADLDEGLSDEKMQWLSDNLNWQPFIKKLVHVALSPPDDDTEATNVA